MKRKDYLQILFFLVKFNLLAAPMYALILMNISFPFLEDWIASFTSYVLNSLGFQSFLEKSTVTVIYGNKIQISNISTDSTGWKSMYALFALVLATPKSILKRKLGFLLFSIPLLFAINLIRIVSTISFSLTFNLSFEFIHTVLWREGLIIAVVAFWVLFLSRENIIRYKSKLLI